MQSVPSLAPCPRVLRSLCALPVAQGSSHGGDEEADFLKFEAKQYLKLGQDENSPFASRSA